jgi:hypothetical protein
MNLFSVDDFKELLRAKKIPFKEGNNGWIGIKCPTCTTKNSYKMRRYIRADIPTSHCFICQQKLLLNDLLNTKIEFDNSLQNIPLATKVHPQAAILPVKEGQAIPIDELPLDHPAIKFLEKDHFHNFKELWEKFNVSFIPAGSALDVKFESGGIVTPDDTLLFPVIINQKLVGYQCRFIPEMVGAKKYTKMKYFHIYNKGKYLYNFDRVKDNSKDFVIVFEGIKKCWKYPQLGVSTLGKCITTEQLYILQNNWTHIILFLDGEDSTQKKAKEIELQMEMNNRFCVRLDPRDYGYPSPDEMTSEEVQRAVDSIINL